MKFMGYGPKCPALNSQFSFGLQRTPVCFHTPATGRAADLVGGYKQLNSWYPYSNMTRNFGASFAKITLPCYNNLAMCEHVTGNWMISFVTQESCCGYKSGLRCYTRPFSPPQVVKGRARQTRIHTGRGRGGTSPPLENPPPLLNQHKYYSKVVLKHKQQSDNCCSKKVCNCSKTPKFFFQRRILAVKALVIGTVSW